MSSPEFFRSVDFYPVINEQRCTWCMKCVHACGLKVISVVLKDNENYERSETFEDNKSLENDASLENNAGLDSNTNFDSNTDINNNKGTKNKIGQRHFQARRRICRNCRKCVESCWVNAISITAQIGASTAGHLKKDCNFE